MLQAPPIFPQPLPPSPRVALRRAASPLTGAKRRACEAARALPDGAGPPRQAASRLGWRRRTVAGGRAASRTGLRCLGAPSACRGRQRWAAPHPQAAADRRRLAEAHAHHTPTLRPPRADTRLTAQAALAVLPAPGEREDHWPAPSTMAAVLHRLGWRWRQVGKAKPPKQRQAPAAIGAHLGPKPRQRRPRPPSNA
jgi:hypothetical protein